MGRRDRPLPSGRPGPPAVYSRGHVLPWKRRLAPGLPLREPALGSAHNRVAGRRVSSDRGPAHHGMTGRIRLDDCHRAGNNSARLTRCARFPIAMIVDGLSGHDLSRKS